MTFAVTAPYDCHCHRHLRLPYGCVSLATVLQRSSLPSHLTLLMRFWRSPFRMISKYIPSRVCCEKREEKAQWAMRCVVENQDAAEHVRQSCSTLIFGSRIYPFGFLCRFVFSLMCNNTNNLLYSRELSNSWRCCCSWSSRKLVSYAVQDSD